MGLRVEDRKPTSRRFGGADWLRLLIPVGLLGLAFLLTLPVVDEYRALREYRNASVCPAGQSRTAGGDDCLVPGTGRVTDKEVGESCTAYSDGSKTCHDEYRVRIRVQGHGEAEWFTVDHVTYQDAARGDPAGALLWQDEVVRTTVRGHTERHEPYFGVKNVYLWPLPVAALALTVAVVVAAGRFRQVMTHSMGVLLVLAVPFLLGTAILFLVEGVVFDQLPTWVTILVAAMSGGFGIVTLVVFAHFVREELD